MRFSLTSFIRLAFLSAAGLTCMAWALAGVAGPKPASRRDASPVKYVGVNTTLLDPHAHSLSLLDRASGRIRSLRLPENDDVDFVSMSPWADENGNRQVVGRWSERNGRELSTSKGEFGLMRMNYPSGEIIDRVSLDILPVSTPCWFPAPSARILFGSGDGKLYIHDFERKDGPAVPREIVWSTARPGTGEVFLAEPCWLENRPGAPRRLAVSIRFVENRNGKPRFSTSRLWWVRLGADDECIVEAGPLVPDEPGAETQDLRSPIVNRDADGHLRLAFLRAGNRRQWELMVTDLDAPSEAGGPIAARRMGRSLAEKCLPTPPSFSEDGRYLNAIKGEIFRGGEVVRISVDPAREGLAAAERIAIPTAN